MSAHIVSGETEEMTDTLKAGVRIASTDRTRTAYKLAMLGLQSDRYARDAEFRDAVDDVLCWATYHAPAT